MADADQKEINEGRRDFIKTITLAGMAAAMPGTVLADQGIDAAIRPNRVSAGGGKKLVCLSNNPQEHEKFIETMGSIPGTDLQVSAIKVDYKDSDKISHIIKRAGYGYSSHDPAPHDLQLWKALRYNGRH